MLRRISALRKRRLAALRRRAGERSPTDIIKANWEPAQASRGFEENLLSELGERFGEQVAVIGSGSGFGERDMDVEVDPAVTQQALRFMIKYFHMFGGEGASVHLVGNYDDDDLPPSMRGASLRLRRRRLAAAEDWDSLEWVPLMKLTSPELVDEYLEGYSSTGSLDDLLEVMGIGSPDDLLGYWVPTDEIWDFPPEEAKQMELQDDRIVAIVHGARYPPQGDFAYVMVNMEEPSQAFMRTEDFERMFV